MLLLLSLLAADAGYGDPVDGVPSTSERMLHVWTNAARVDPLAFQDVYPCPLTVFRPSELEAQQPLVYHQGLNEIARLHSEDMRSVGAISHTSSDGTSMGARVAPYYEGGFVGENVAAGHLDPFDTVMRAWMCSTGHRANIMEPAYSEFGGGIASEYMTQNFGDRGVSPYAYPISIGGHEAFVGELTLYAVVYTAEPPTTVQAWVNGVAVPLELSVGEAEQGLYTALVSADAGCSTYWFEVVQEGGARTLFPEEGAYGIGDCGWDDEEARWMVRPAEPEDDDDDDDEERGGCGCAAAPHPASALGLLPALLLLRRRP